MPPMLFASDFSHLCKYNCIVKKIELMKGYRSRVYLTVRQLDEAKDQSCNSLTRLIRNLMMVFFTPTSLVSEKKNYPALSNYIIETCQVSNT